MDKDTRNAIERATQRARKLLEEDFAAQLEGDFDVHRDGVVAPRAGGHLSARQAFQRDRIVAALEHKRAAGMSAADAARDYLRDAAFTTLNRFVALKMLEARQLLQECITKGEQSAGYREFCGMAPGLPLLPDSVGYRLYIDSLFDELSTEVKVLFDRRDPSSVLWPKRTTFGELLEVLNASELARAWAEDETIGWVYQFFNGQDERRNMREESQAPRNSRELAVRNQFFTPRYVVQFLTDNTLGRIWYEMRRANTVLAERCEYMVRTPEAEFVSRTKKDPRDVRVLDPACGSGHFLLYAFDLLLAIYEEAYADSESPRSEATGCTLAQDYPSPDAFREAIPSLILGHNLHGVDIDPRCVQIAQLALWMRAQKALRDSGVGRAQRSQIRRSHIVVAEPLVADEQLVREFVAKLGDAQLGRVFTELVEALNLGGDMGLLLRLESLVASPTKRGRTGDLFAPSEERIRAALEQFVAEEGERLSIRRRLFADDAVQGMGLLAVAERKFDVLLMNPPFGDPTPRTKTVLAKTFPDSKGDIYGCFIERGLEIASTDGLLGVICPRTCIFKTEFASWREHVFGERRNLDVVADLGPWVLDQALVETCLLVVRSRERATRSTTVLRLLNSQAKGRDLLILSKAEGPVENRFLTGLELFSNIPGQPWLFYLPDELLGRFTMAANLRGVLGRPLSGLCTGDDFSVVRLWWEPSPERINRTCWAWHSKGGEYQPFFEDVHLVVNWQHRGRNMSGALVRNESRYFAPGLSYPLRTRSSLGPRVLRRGIVFSQLSQVCLGGTTEQQLALIAYLVLRTPQVLLEALLGSGDAMSAQGTARSYTAQAVERLPVPETLSHEAMSKLSRFTRRVVAFFARRAKRDVASPLFCLPRVFATGGDTFRGAVERTYCDEMSEALEILDEWDTLDELSMRAMELSDQERRHVADEYGPRFEDLADAPECPSRVVEDLRRTERDLLAEIGGDAQRSRLLLTKSFIVDRRLELVARRHGVRPRTLARFVTEGRLLPKDAYWNAALDTVHALMGIVFGRHRLTESGFDDSAIDPFEELIVPADVLQGRTRASDIGGVFADDEGSDHDIVAALQGATISARLPKESCSPTLIDEVVTELGATELREFLRAAFFQQHITRFSASRRKAPIYWQLATASASYSVWVYIHAFTKDTLFRVQNDYAAPKLAHEERRLESLTRQFRDKATATQRKELAAQEIFVEELRAFVDELRRVAPLWTPNLDDGVVINFAPLWRLVPHHRPWQKELRSTWDALCVGEYDWTHLAMHLWPERVVPRCATDQTLAIAHRLEDVFWVEGDDGKWTARKTRTRSVDELVRERTSPAVKSALKSMLEAPTATSNGARGRGGRRRYATAANGGVA
jgi:hypothetical protein